MCAALLWLFGMVLLAPAEVGQADPPTDEPKLAFERLVAFFKQHLA